jgi:hypothetical protein
LAEVIDGLWAAVDDGETVRLTLPRV